MIHVARDAGISDEEVLDLLRVLGRGLSQVAETLRTLPLKLVLEPGMSEPELANRYAQAASALYPLVNPLVESVLTLHLQTRHAERRSSASSSEAAASCQARARSRSASPTWSDSRGSARKCRPTSSAASPCAWKRSRPTRRRRRCGWSRRSATQRCSPRRSPSRCSAQRSSLIEAADAEGEDFPQLRAGAALGKALPRAGDWFGRPVNLASRITSVARPGSLLAERELRESVDEAYRWSFAGERRLRGIRGAVPLFRARREGGPLAPS